MTRSCCMDGYDERLDVWLRACSSFADYGRPKLGEVAELSALVGYER